MNRSLLLFLALATACGENDSPLVASAEQTAALCDLYRVACERQAECGVYLYNRTTDAARCEDQLACEEVAAGAAAADIAVSIDNATSCRDTLAGSTCEGLVLWNEIGIPSALTTTDAACKNVLEGTRASGETCGWTQQCEPGFECAGDTCPGSCRKIVEQCRVGGCGSDAWCSSDGSCVARAGLGETCGIADFFENSCGDDLVCEFSGTSFEGTCGRASARGETCGNLSFFACTNGDACIDNRCAPPKSLGAACSASDECGIEAFCAFDDGNVCKPQRALGERCFHAGFECGPNAECNAATNVCTAIRTGEPPAPGTPKPFARNGEDCSLANCEAGLACRPRAGEWTCAPAPALGESCRPANPDDEFVVLLSGTNGVGGCLEGVCDVFGSWTCVIPGQPGDACPAPGLTAACASVVCGLDRRCADYFEECPFQ